MADVSWKDAILRVLREESGEVHYAEIAQTIIDRKYRSKGSVGATPAATVAAILSTQLTDQVYRVKRGHYALIEHRDVTLQDSSRANVEQASGESEVAEDAAQMGLINAFGMFWRRPEVSWQTRNPRLLGVQQSGSKAVDFAMQAGVYILYDGDRIVYVGRVTEPRLATRLWEHTRDRLTGRWDRFSWFGVRAVGEDGALGPVPEVGIDIATLIATMEALLIEGLEPPQNRRRGDNFNAMEFIQKTDPEVERARRRALLHELGHGL